MGLMAKLALSQIKINRNRSVMALIGIALSTAMLTAVCGFVASTKPIFEKIFLYDYGNTNNNFTILAIGAILGIIIIITSVVVVSNAFRVSAAERTMQFGILKSVGATKKQIAASVLYEGMFLCVIGIPIGIAAGLLIDLTSTSIITNLLTSLSGGGILHVNPGESLTMSFVITPIMFVVAVTTSFITVLISAWFPARKATKISAIDAIRSTGEVHLKSENVRTSRLTQTLFGFEGTLAAKALKRSSRNFRATVVSLTISIVLLIVAGSFVSMMKSSASLVFPDIGATAAVSWSSDIKDKGSKFEYLPLSAENAEIISEKLQNYNGATIYGIGGFRSYTSELPNGTAVKSSLISVDAKHYEELCKTAGVPLGSNLLINMRRDVVNGTIKDYVPYDFSALAGKPLEFSLAGHAPVEIKINGELKENDIPLEIAYMKTSHQLTVIVPKCESSDYFWYAKVDDIAGFTKYAEQVLNDFAPKSTDKIKVNAQCVDVAGAMKQTNNLVNTVMCFVYGFVLLLTLIAVTSVISTISTSIHSRTREFAVLESIGMTKSGLKKMLNLESILCSVKSLIIGIPLGIISAFCLYRSVRVSMEIPFNFPLLSIMECILGVFIITWVTMQYSAGKLKGGSIIETIRGE